MNIIKKFKLFCENRAEKSIDWKDLYYKAKDTSGENFKEFEKEYSEILDVPHIKDALDKADDFDSFKKMIGKIDFKIDLNESMNEKYKHTSEDKEQDMELIKEFADKFESEIGSKIELKELTKPKFKDYLGHGAEKIYRVKHSIEDESFDSIDQYGMVWISTDINPHGVTSDGEPHRTFTINFELKGKKTIQIEEDGEEITDVARVKKFYSYSSEMDDIINQFEEYIENEIR